MAAPKHDLTTRLGAARHHAEQDKIMEKAIAEWHEANRRFTALTAQTDVAKVRRSIIEEYRFNAVASYEALLDAMTNARDALNILSAARAAHPLPKPKRPEA